MATNTPPTLSKELSSVTVNTGAEFAVELPISSATDKEGDAIITKVQIDKSSS